MPDFENLPPWYVADSVDLEPYTDTNNDGLWNENEYFDDWNQNGFRDSCYINLIYDTTYKDVYELWKETYPRGSNQELGWKKNSPFRYNPWVRLNSAHNYVMIC